MRAGLIYGIHGGINSLFITLIFWDNFERIAILALAFILFFTRPAVEFLCGQEMHIVPYAQGIPPEDKWFRITWLTITIFINIVMLLGWFGAN